MSTNPRTREHFPHMKTRGKHRHPTAVDEVLDALHTTPTQLITILNGITTALAEEAQVPTRLLFHEGVQMRCGHDDTTESGDTIVCIDCDAVVAWWDENGWHQKQETL